MADKLHFSLVSPERELFAGAVDHVVVPGSEGEFGVLAQHAPFMSTVRPGALRILNDGEEQRIFVNGGFADVTPDGLTVLAEDAVDLATLSADQVAADIKDCKEDLADAKDDAVKTAAQTRLKRLEAIQAALR